MTAVILAERPLSFAANRRDNLQTDPRPIVSGGVQLFGPTTSRRRPHLRMVAQPSRLRLLNDRKRDACATEAMGSSVLTIPTPSGSVRVDFRHK